MKQSENFNPQPILILNKSPTMGVHPRELGQHNERFADLHVLHVHVDERGDGVDGADGEHLDEDLGIRQFMIYSK